ncbi:MAG: hypothetical protein ACI4NI_10155 [Candidatus Ornithospirochaeta sp.]
MEKYINTNLLILIPMTMLFGFVLKTMWTEDKFHIRKLIKTTRGIKVALYIIDIALASIIGLTITQYSGWKMIIDAFVRLGLCHGATCCYVATKLYDKSREM